MEVKRADENEKKRNQTFLLSLEEDILFHSPLFSSKQRRLCSPLSAAAAPAARWRRWPARREGERYDDDSFLNVNQQSTMLFVSVAKKPFTPLSWPLLASFLMQRERSETRVSAASDG